MQCVWLGPLRLRPSLFYRRIDGYIQGTPVPATMLVQIAIATMNGDATPLIASNVDAKLYGADADLTWQVAPQLRLDGTISYVRGQRRDIADNLYRIAPLNGRLALTWDGSGWSVTAEAVGAAAQRRNRDSRLGVPPVGSSSDSESPDQNETTSREDRWPAFLPRRYRYGPSAPVWIPDRNSANQG